MKKGSALLIVLGMMAFMVVSAVAFSALMRTSRLPSSFLRRASTSRLLVKAALAEAIDEIDGAIGNNPHPGVGTEAPRAGVGLASSDLNGLNADARTRNHWRGRVYIGTNELYSSERTVSTLTLEGLAYIPPALVNEARYYSRRSQAGSWKKLGFDAGRYAFCAIDVSDYFDVNALLANVARSSAAGTRISLAYLFESTDHTSQSGGGGTPAQWDDFMKDFTDEDKVPLVSMADWNLAVNAESPCGMLSEFCQFVSGGRTSFYGGIGENGEQAEKIRRQSFVTDSLFPSRTTYTTSGGGTLKRFDLCSSKNQPFLESELRVKNRSVFTLAMDRTAHLNVEPLKQLEQSLSGLGFAALYDYLDSDDLPVSLAVPTTERVPMICALMPEMNGGNFEVEATEPDGAPKLNPDPSGAQPGQKYTITYKVKYAIKGIPNAPVGALVTYPFRHQDVPNTHYYEIGGRLSYFLTVEGEDIGLRTGNPNDILHIGYKPDVSSVENVENAALTVPFRPQEIQLGTFSGDKQGPAGAVQRMSLMPNGTIPSSIPFLEVEYVSRELVYEDDGEGKAVPPRTTISLSDGDKATAATCSWQPLKADGTVHGSFSAAGLLNTLNSADFSKRLKVNLAVWAWIRHSGSTDEYVDMVPACGYDDADLNLRGRDQLSKKFSQDYLGGAYPLMRFDTAENGQRQFVFASADAQKGVLKTDAGAQFKLTPQSVMVCDPRYNHAPESWFAYAGQISDGNAWLDNNECGWNNANGVRRDGDIFMQVSDQEYLQSAYELANLPRLTDFYQVGTKWGPLGFYENPANKNFTSFPATAAETANFDLMWRTYDPFSRYLDGGDNFEECGFVNEAPGFRVNPYSDMTNVVLAAFANTPHEWRVASTNDAMLAIGNVPEDAVSFNRKYAWNEYSSGAALLWEDLEDLASDFIGRMRGATSPDRYGTEWEDRWYGLGWYDAQKKGDELSKYLLPGFSASLQPEVHDNFDERVYNTDRKFLYGYWHDCFAVKQQLFLVFVRAEPLMSGGAAGALMLPQLGARAVALVWRDPAATADSQTPHRTRVLFYRQFE